MISILEHECFFKGHAQIISYLHSLSCTDSADSVMWPNGHDPHPNHGSGYREKAGPFPAQ